MRRLALAGVLALLVVLAGCIGGPVDVADGGDGTVTATTTPTPTPAQPTVDTHVLDTSPYGPTVVEGGVAAQVDDTRTSRYYVTTIGGAGEATDRLNRSEIGGDGRAFVDATDFETSFLVVIQVFPHSSVPDHRVDSVRRSGGTLSLVVNDSSRGGTADITLETMLVRVEGAPPESVRVTTDEGFSWTSRSGLVTRTPEPTRTDTGVDLPYRSEDPTENVDEPRDVVVENRGSETNGYHVEVEYLLVPDCRDATPPCEMPTKEVGVLGERGKLRPGATKRFEDVVARRGHYTVTVSADVPADDGSRRTVRARTQWTLDADAPDVHVVITDDDVRFVSPEADSDRDGGDGDSTATGPTATPQTTAPG